MKNIFALSFILLTLIVFVILSSYQRYRKEEKIQYRQYTNSFEVEIYLTNWPHVFARLKAPIEKRDSLNKVADSIINKLKILTP
jgi:hypothetical protein